MKRWHWIVLSAVVLVSVVVELVAPRDPEKATHWWNAIPAFYALFGFVGCAVIILFSKVIGKLFVLKKENYYDAE